MLETIQDIGEDGHCVITFSSINLLELNYLFRFFEKFGVCGNLPSSSQVVPNSHCCIRYKKHVRL